MIFGVILGAWKCQNLIPKVVVAIRLETEIFLELLQWFSYTVRLVKWHMFHFKPRAGSLLEEM